MGTPGLTLAHDADSGLRAGATERPRWSRATVPSPLGPIVLVAREDVLCGLYWAGQDARHRGPSRANGDAFATVIEQLDAYWSRTSDRFDVAIAPLGSVWQKKVWSTLLQVPYGSTITYRDLAVEVGAPRASRAVGRANATNPISIIVPCHRVVGSDGSLTGYGGGLARKRALLELESAGPPRASR